MKHENISLVIQGPLDKTGLDCINNYTKYVDDIIISCWSNYNSELLQYIPEGVTFISNELPKFSCCGTFYWQILSTFYGCKLAKYDHVLKVRCDEYYPNISDILKCIKDNPEKLVTNNIWFNSDKVCKFHVSDHMWGGKTQKIVDFLSNYMIPRLTNQILFIQPIKDYIYGPPEIVLTKSWIDYCGDFPDEKCSKELMLKHVSMIPVSQMGKFIAKAGKQAMTDINYLKQYNSIFSMDEF
jgi:hypothetical protein